jgi:hypothetical protein
MGEIKSTLDLVMEKTKHLSLTHEEREEQKRKEIENCIRGLIQKFQDQIISIEQLKSEYQSLQQKNDLSENIALIKEVFDRVALGEDNQALLELIKEFKAWDLSGFVSILKDYQDAIQLAVHGRKEQLKQKLAKENLIAGSAVVPNLEVDEVWRAESRKIRAEFEAKLNQEKSKLLNDMDS